MGEYRDTSRGRDGTAGVIGSDAPAAQTLAAPTTDYALRPEIPIVMRPGARIQFGVEPERSMILPLSDGTPPGPVFSALLAAHRGSTLSEAFADSHDKLSPQFITALISDLHRAALVQKPPTRRRITLIGRDSLRTGLLKELRRTGCGSWTTAMSPTRNATLKVSQSTPEDIGLAVVTGMEVPSMPLVRALFHRGIEHLHTHFRDGALILGPLVQPGQGPCSMCFEAYRRDRDPVRALIALQLRTFTPVTAPEWLNTAVPLLVGQLRRPDLSDLCATEVRIDLESLDITRTTVAPHPQCPVCGHGNSQMQFM